MSVVKEITSVNQTLSPLTWTTDVPKAEAYPKSPCGTMFPIQSK